MVSGDRPGAIQLFRQRLIEDLVDQGALSRSRHTGHAGHNSKRHINIDIFQVILPRATDFDPARGASSLLRHRNFDPAAQIRTGDRFLTLHDLGCRSHSDHISAVFPGPRTDIHDTVRRPHRILIVFHDDHTVSEIPKMFQRFQQLIVISLVQSDTRLIKDIGNPHKSGADLGRQTDSLCLAAGKGTRRPG